MTLPTAVVVTVKGRVQRVGYRRYVLDIAQEEGISGEVRNQNDGTVLVFAQAEGRALTSFLRRLRTPPPPAFVKDAQERKARPKKSKGFRMVSQGLAEEMQEGFGAMQSEFSDYKREFRNFAGQTRVDFKELGGKLDGFAIQTNKNFTNMNQKYGEISEKLSAIMTQLSEQLQSMRSEAKETAATLNESLKLLREAVDRLPKPT